MKKIKAVIIVFLVFLTASVNAQSVSDTYSEAMEAYKADDFNKCYTLFEKFFTGYNQYDELYSSAKYYSAESLLKLGKNDAAANSFEFLVNNFTNTNFREMSLYKLGMIYYDNKEFEKSRERLKTLLSVFPSTEYKGNSLYWIGETFTVEEKYEEAIETYLQAITIRSNNKFIDRSMYSLAYAYEKTGKYEDAVSYYDKLLSFYPDSPIASLSQIRIGICYFKLKDYDSSILELNNPLISNLPKEQIAEALYLSANAYFKVKEYDNAEKAYLEIIKKYPKSSVFQDVRYALGWTYFLQKKYADAYKIFNTLSDGKDTIAPKAMYWKGEAKRYLGEESEALKIYEAFLKKYPDNPARYKVYYQSGIIQYNQKKYEQAEKNLKPIFNTDDDQLKSKAYTLAGEIKLNKKEYNAAIPLYESALKIEGLDLEKKNRALFGLAISYYYIKDYTKSLKFFADLEARTAGFESDKANFYTGEIKFEKESYQEALKYYSKVDPANQELGPAALYAKGYCCYNLKDYENAVYYFSEFVKKSTAGEKQLDARLRMADCYFVNRNYASAGKIYQEIFKGSKNIPNADYAYFQYAQSLFKAEKYSEAINEFNSLRTKFPKSQYADQSLYFIGWINFQQAKYYDAIRSYKNVKSIYPGTSLSALLEYSIGDSYYNMGNYDSAIVSYTYVLDNYPSSNYVMDAVNGIQYSYIAKNEPEKAAAIINDFVQKNSGQNFADQLFFKKGEIFYGQKLYDKAKASYSEFISLYPKSHLIPDAYYWLGKCWQNMNKQDEALRNYEIVVRSYPSNQLAASAAIESGAIYNGQKKYDKAIALYNQVLGNLTGSPRAAEILFLKGYSLSGKGDLQGALDTYDEVIQYYAGTIFAEKSKLETGVISYMKKNYDNAAGYFKSLSENRSDDLGAKAQFYLGVSLYESKKYTEAITALVRVGTIFPNYDEWATRANLKLGECYEKMKEPSKAKEMYKLVISTHKGDEFGKEAQTKLRNVR